MNCALGSDNILNDTVLYRVIYEAVGNVLPCGLSYVVAGLAMMMILVNGVLVGAGLFSWVERRLSLAGSTTVLAQIAGVRLAFSSLWLI